jgi:group I intron endonuclease
MSRKENLVIRASHSLFLPLSKCHENRAGIYCIFNTKNGNKYIGQTKNFGERKKAHFYELKTNRHHNRHLQNAYNLYFGKFSFCIVEFLKDYSLLDEREQYWIDTLKPEYNILLDVYHYGGARGENQDSPETFYIEGESFERPYWHKFVYGGEKNPNV